MKKKKAYSMIELIMAVGSLLLVLGVFSVIVKTYLEEFSEGTLGERKWADVQTFFTYVNRDLETLADSLGTGETLEINSDGTIEVKTSDGTVTDSVVYSIDDSTGEISRDGTVIVKVNNNFEISGLKLKVYENILTENSINSSWEYDELEDDPVIITSEDGSNYYIEPVIKLSEGSEITGGYALRFDNVTESSGAAEEEIQLPVVTVSEDYLYYYNYYYNLFSETDYYYTEDYYNYINYYYNYSGYYHYNVKIDADTDYNDYYKISVKADFETGKYNSVTGISYYDEEASKWISLSEVSVDSSDQSIEYQSTEEVYVGDTIRLKFTLSNNSGLSSNKDVSVTVDVYDSE